MRVCSFVWFFSFANTTWRLGWLVRWASTLFRFHRFFCSWLVMSTMMIMFLCVGAYANAYTSLGILVVPGGPVWPGQVRPGKARLGNLGIVL